jgi:sporulation protein YlmC with PRC-barrel domain
MISGCDLEGKIVRGENGEVFGRVSEIQIKDAQVTALLCGPAAFWQRFTSAGRIRRIPWNRVRRIGPDIVITTKAD